MRTVLLAVAAVTAAGLVVPATTAAAGAAELRPAGSISYRDPALAQSASVSVTGTLTPIHNEVTGDSYAVSLPNGHLIPVSLDAHAGEIEQPRSFTGDIAITDGLADRLADRGVAVDDGDDVSSTTSEGKVVVAAAAASAQALPVQTATIGSAPAQNTHTATTATSTHRLYVAEITNRGTLDSDPAVATKLSAMRQYWQTESDGLISSFTQPTATVEYASSAADSTHDGCGLANPTPVWNEAAAQFPSVNFSSPGNHLMVLVPNACGANGAAGIGTVGRSLSSGGRTIVTLGDTALAIGVHELGHNLSLQHANAERCAPCSTKEYWDLYSIMGLAVSGGTWTPAALDTSYRLLTGIDDSTSVPTITTSSSVHLSGRATSSGTRGLVVSDPSSGSKYTVEYRSGAGRDAKAFYATSRTIGGYVFRPGVVVERMQSDGSTTMITTLSGSNYVMSFVSGQSVILGSLKIAVTSASAASGATVSITLPGTEPSASPSPPARFTPGTPVVRGTPRVGQRLSVATTPWSPTPERYRVQWMVAGRPLAGAVNTTLLLSKAEYGKRISVVMTGFRSGFETASRTSTSTRAVAAGLFTPHSVRIVGRAKVGHRLTIATRDWHPSPVFSYRWYANGHQIRHAGGRTLKITKSLRGKRITARLTARGYAYLPASVVTRTMRVR